MDRVVIAVGHLEVQSTATNITVPVAKERGDRSRTAKLTEGIV
jgi:hypothetical protein